jgi:hypothetical protein
LGNGGGFQYAVGDNIAAYSIAAGDFNGDGKLDLAAANSAGVVILLGNGNGTFGPPHTYLAGSEPYSVAVGDFNGDGKLDLAVANKESNNVSILLGKGDGTFGPQVTYNVGSFPLSLAVGDFNGDGKPDLAVANSSSNASPCTGCTVSILLGKGDGTFRSQETYAVGVLPYSVAVGDFNGDGKPDLAVANFGVYPFTSPGSVSILLGNGDGTFQPQVAYLAGDGARAVDAADFDGDGKLDLAVVNYYSRTVSILRGNGDGTFRPSENYLAGVNSAALAVGDFNRDGRPDLAVANDAFLYPAIPSANDVTVMTNTTPR